MCDFNNNKSLEAEVVCGNGEKNCEVRSTILIPTPSSPPPSLTAHLNP